MGISPGNIAASMPPSETDQVRKARDLARSQREQAVALVAAQTQIGSGGLLVNGGGSITISGTGSLNVGSGALNSAGSISAATTISAGGAITGSSVAATGNVSGATVSSGSSITAGGAVSGSTGSFNGGLFSTAVYSTVVSGTRSATWTENTGTIGTAPSSIRYKTNVIDADWSEARVLALFSVSSKYYNYKSEVAKRDDPKSPDYVGPQYHVHQEIGYIAEELHAAGLWEFVVYERDMVTKVERVDVPVETSVGRGTMMQAVEVMQGDTLRLNKNGEPIPLSVHYELLGIAAIEAAKWLWGRMQSLEADMAAVKAHLGL